MNCVNIEKLDFRYYLFFFYFHYSPIVLYFVTLAEMHQFPSEYYDRSTHFTYIPMSSCINLLVLDCNTFPPPFQKNNNE